MPILKPEIQNLLRQAGLEKAPTDSSFSDKIENAGLTDTQIAEELFNMACNSGNEALRLRALELTLKVKGKLKDTPATQIPSLTIVIQGSGQIEGQGSTGINPILVPRQSTTTKIQ